MIGLAKSYAPPSESSPSRPWPTAADEAPKLDPKGLRRRISTDPDPRVRLQAAIASGRLGMAESGPSVLALTADADPLVAHAPVKALVKL